MKGPSLRLKFDFRRRWECPACHARVRTAGAVTSVECACSQQTGRRNLMQLIFDGEAMLRWRAQVPVAATAAPAAESIESQWIDGPSDAQAELPFSPPTLPAEPPADLEDPLEAN